MFFLRIMFYDPLDEQNWMCELCMFSQIRSHMSTAIEIWNVLTSCQY